MNTNCRRKEKVYVKVTSDFDATGYMQPGRYQQFVRIREKAEGWKIG